MVASSIKVSLFIIILSTVVFFVHRFLYTVPPIPEYEEKWWGSGEPKKVDDSIRQFKVNMSQEDLQDLNYRLKHTLPFQRPLEGVKQHYGMNTNLLQNVTEFWRTKYNWKERETFFNQYPHYLVNIQGLDIHFVHIKPKVPKSIEVLPMIMLHGWAGSIREFYDIVPLLTTPQEGRDFVFELIIPSLPGFGFSEATNKPGLGAFHMSVILKNLMLKIGHQRFYLHGTDWGSVIAQHMSVLFPEHIIAFHSNFCVIDTALSNLKLLIYSLYPSLFVDKVEEEIMFPLSKRYNYFLVESGYFHIQATKPDTIGVALRESPTGLAAYLLEKFVTLTNTTYKDLEDGGLTEKFTYTQLLDNIMVYWMSRSITTSMRIYAELFHEDNRGKLRIESIPIKVPTGCARFRYEVMFFSEDILMEKYPNLIHLTYYDGGHFPALEQPSVLAKDIFSFIEKTFNN
uniref:Epoxide hydrolase n=1 Tax=Diabrotica virgifera virgifera TaxID=50390 RepID=A0A6P7H7W2_DIAVI